MIEVENLIKVYRRGEIEVIAIRDVTLSIKDREFVMLVGPSGSGKTTFLHLLGGIDRPTAGKIFVNGKNIAFFNDKELTDYRRKDVGMVFQFFNLIPTLTAIENVMLPMQFIGMGRSERKKRAEELLKLVGIYERKDHYPDEMSGGEQQRVAIAVALANDPPLILADEPTGELDTQTGLEIIKIFKKLNDEGKTVIIATHDMRLEKYATRILEIRDGKITG
ncbi:ABC transporter ATP-binding protein [Candidatus Aciduliprofundum boonei]|uniref:ABC transporter related protein n=1 Tax=Aciduliprofundum boonei (strain DSM 19572 / T469) TaxID=439481 RepID=B5IA74_ACIB4|nr:ABC transporter ATP-binding protein [Candidatus Aciduliprofundum boonei]ADD08289.1 ABC transporter related protein [Aciduliprofundum boonei T469]EDY36883.1 ABC transporter, ATP-binding protein, putative [Aciduliprofundum boonei T469]HII54636.1 ABC transporter ATP-binding protein [Candidatus Aciduliprofundum boonei]